MRPTNLQQTTLETFCQKFGKPLGTKVSPLKRVENIVVKGVIAHNEQILILPQCFQK